MGKYGNCVVKLYKNFFYYLLYHAYCFDHLLQVARMSVFLFPFSSFFLRESKSSRIILAERTEKLSPLDRLTIAITESSVLREIHRCCNDVTWKLPLEIAHAGAINTRCSREQCLKALTIISIH